MTSGNFLHRSQRSGVRSHTTSKFTTLVAVLGDAKLLFPMRRSDDKVRAFDRGSIDKIETKKAVINILEGGDVAFRQRREIYSHYVSCALVSHKGA